jgi:type VI protein secretion system component VasK
MASRSVTQWQRTRLADRAQAIVIHELAEHDHGDHRAALIAAPETNRPISHAAQQLLRQMQRGWIGP